MKSLLHQHHEIWSSVQALLAGKMFPSPLPSRPLSAHLLSDVSPVAHNVPPQEEKFVRRAYIEFRHSFIAATEKVVFNAAIVKLFQISEHTSVFIIGSPVSSGFYLSLLRRLSQVNQYHFLVANYKPSSNSDARSNY